MKLEKLPYQANVRASRKFQPLETVHGIELGGKHFRKRLDTRAARPDERAIDVEKNQPHVQPRDWIIRSTTSLGFSAM